MACSNIWLMLERTPLDGVKRHVALADVEVVACDAVASPGERLAGGRRYADGHAPRGRGPQRRPHVALRPSLADLVCWRGSGAIGARSNASVSRARGQDRAPG